MCDKKPEDQNGRPDADLLVVHDMRSIISGTLVSIVREVVNTGAPARFAANFLVEYGYGGAQAGLRFGVISLWRNECGALRATIQTLSVDGSCLEEYGRVFLSPLEGDRIRDNRLLMLDAEGNVDIVVASVPRLMS